MITEYPAISRPPATMHVLRKNAHRSRHSRHARLSTTKNDPECRARFRRTIW